MLDLINKISSVENPAASNRINSAGRNCHAFTEVEDRAFDLIAGEAQKLLATTDLPPEDYNISSDAAGNLFITLYGTNREKSVICGSHADSVLNGGVFDGPAGLNSAFNFLKSLLESGQKPRFNYVMAVFRAEESSPKTGVACLGSRIATGTITAEELGKITYNTNDRGKIPLKAYWTEKFGPGSWEKLLAQLENPVITPENTVHYEELHIEQSRVCELNGADAGIVTGGIGSAIRETVKSAPRIPQTINVTPENPHVKINVVFTGREAHTGGTPPNYNLIQRKGGMYYRNDALVAASHFTLRLLRSAVLNNLEKYVKIIKSAPLKETGFTTVPTAQKVEILVPVSARPMIAGLIMDTFHNTCPHFGVWGGTSTENVNEGTFTEISDEDIEAFNIPVLVESAIREEVKEQIDAGKNTVGTVRGTVTDFSIDGENGTSFKLDLRDVDTETMSEIRREIHDRIMDILPAEITVLDCKPFTPVDRAAAETKEKIAQTLGMKTVSMPSLPGHDAASLAKAGIPVSMTFVAHDGSSHNPSEKMNPENYAKAEKLSHEFLKSLLF